MSSVYGQILTGSEVEQHVIDILKKWMPNYIDEVMLQIGWTGSTIPAPRSYTTRNRPEHFIDDQLPQCIVVSPGLADPPLKQGDGTYRASFAVGVGVVASAKDEPHTKALARFYAAVVRAILIQHKSLDNKAIGLDWYDESYDDIPDEKERRNLASGTCYFRIEYENVVMWPGGPRVPSAPVPSGDPYPGESRWPDPATIPSPAPGVPDVEEVIVTLKREAL